MHSKAALAALTDIVENIRLAQSFITGLDLDSFTADRRTVYAVTRCLEIISEASRRLPEEIKARHPQIPWLDIAGAGNIYRHDYEDVLVEIVWRTTGKPLELLLSAVEDELRR